MTTRFTWILVALLTTLLASLSPASAQTSTLTVLKQTPPYPDYTVFSFTIEGDDGVVPFSLQSGQSQQLTLDPGTYTVREDLPENWVLALARCGTSLYQVGPIASGAVRLALGPGDDVTCRFLNTNDQLPLPQPPGGAPTEIPVLSPTGLSVLLMALSLGGAFLLRKTL